ncbi:SAM-dependent methyltransferase [Peribacillus sp. SCS-155]|uniref:SAM-dependent methyltransferase n=1 Tax=Peribacillus sedimenti TaxID=3115297 RepID=UPI0039064EC1
MTSIELNGKTAAFLSTYKLFETDEIQQVQLQHRMDLVEAFGIETGMSVLEIGCGQGDTTAALADAVGEKGKVIAIDIASRDYGSPLTLGQATDIIKKSVLGERIAFHFETDFDTYESSEIFDVAVLSHSSWYFKKPEDLLRYFQKLRGMAKCICFAEWDLDFT